MARVLAIGLLACLLVVGASSASRQTQAKSDGLILFWSESPWPSIWSIRPDGSHLRRILKNHQNGKRPRLSPDRSWVAFDGASPGKAPLSDFDIELVRPDGSGLRTLTRSSQWDLDVQWSPDGRRISFARMPPGAVWRRAWIWSVRPDGGGLRRLTRGQGGRWSPDGRRLVLDATTGRSDGDLFVVNEDGSGRRRLTATPALEAAAAWSPDGKKILFTRFRSSDGSDVVVMKADGTEVRKLADGIAATWSPDGSKILYTSSSRLFVMDGNGSHKRRVASVEASDPSWR